MKMQLSGLKSLTSVGAVTNVVTVTSRATVTLFYVFFLSCS